MFIALETAVPGGQALPGLLLASGQHLHGDISRFFLLSLPLGMRCVTVARTGLQEDLDGSPGGINRAWQGTLEL